MLPTAPPVRSPIAALLAVIIPVVLFVAPLPSLPTQARQALAITLFATISWLSGTIRAEYAGLVTLLAFPLTGTTTFEATFAYFGSKALWLMIGGMIIGLGVTETGLGRRLALLGLRVLGGNYWRMLLGLAFAGYALAFLIPSAMVRVVLLAPLAVELARVLKQEKGSAGAAGIFLALGASTYYAGYSVLTGGLPNIIVLGILEKEGMTIFWGQWAARMIPVFGLGAVFAVYSSLRLWFRAPQLPGDPRTLTRELELLGPPSAAERRVIWLLGLAIALWATDFLHHIHPTFVALLVSILLFVPYVGILDFEAVRALNFSIVFFYIGAVFAIGMVLQSTGFTAWASGEVLATSGLERLGWFGRHYALTLIASLFALFMDTLAESSVITPIFLQYAKAHGMDAINTAFSLAIGYAFPYFPYQAAPMIFLLGYGYVTPPQVLRATLFVGGAGILVLAPIAMIYWRLLGLI